MSARKSEPEIAGPFDEELATVRDQGATQRKLRLALPDELSAKDAPPEESFDDDTPPDPSPLGALVQSENPVGPRPAAPSLDSRFQLRKAEGQASPLVSRREIYVITGILAAGLAIWGMTNGGNRRGPLVVLRDTGKPPPRKPRRFEQAPVLPAEPPPPTPETPPEPPWVEPPKTVTKPGVEQVVDGETGEVLVPRTVRVTSSPVGAAVFIGGNLAGQTPLDTSFPANGPLRIRIELPGFSSWELDVPPNAQSEYVVDAQLVRK